MHTVTVGPLSFFFVLDKQTNYLTPLYVYTQGMATPSIDSMFPFSYRHPILSPHGYFNNGSTRQQKVCNAMVLMNTFVVCSETGLW